MRILDTDDFGAAVRKRRKELGYTQAELASYCGCSAVYLSNLEVEPRTGLRPAFNFIRDISCRGSDFICGWERRVGLETQTPALLSPAQLPRRPPAFV